MASKKILIDIQISDGKASQVVKKTKGSVDALASATKKLNNLQKQEAVDLEILNQRIKIQKEVNVAAAKSTLEMSTATRGLTGALANNKATSGLNNAILQESSRLASDAAYGFQGMANNIGQLVSLLQISANNAGGFANTIKELGKSIMGTGGILIGIQVLISFLPKIAKRLKEAKAAADPVSDAFSNMKDKVDDTSSTFETYISTLESSTKSDEQKEIAIKRLNKEFPDYIKSLDDASVSLDDVKNSTKEAAKANDEYRDSIIKLAMSQAAQDKIQELSAEVIDKKVKRQRELNALGIKESELKQEAANQDNVMISEFSEMEDEKRLIAIKRLNEETEGHNQFLKEKKEQMEALQQFIILEDPNSSNNKDRRKKARAFELETTRTTHEELVKRQKMLKEAFKNFFGIQVVSNEKMLDENIDSADEAFKIFSHRFKDNQRRLREQLRDIIKSFKENAKEQATTVNTLFKTLGKTSGSLGELQKSFHDAEIARLRERKNVILNNDKLTSSEKEAQVAKIEKLEKAAEIRRIKAERDYFTLQQSLLIGQEVMRVKFHVMEQVRMAKLNAVNAQSALTDVAVEGAAQAGKASMSLGSYVSQLGPLGVATFAASIGGILASILAARKKAQAQIASLSGISSSIGEGGSSGTGIAAPDFNVVGASETSQIGQALGAAQSNLTVDLYWSEVEKMNNQNRINTNMIQT